MDVLSLHHLPKKGFICSEPPVIICTVVVVVVIVNIVGTESQVTPVPSTSWEPGKLYSVLPGKKISWRDTLFPHCPLADVASHASHLPSILAHGRVESFG